MRECQQCGEANQPNSRFCVVCGTPLAAVVGVARGAQPAGVSSPVASPLALASVSVAPAVAAVAPPLSPLPAPAPPLAPAPSAAPPVAIHAASAPQGGGQVQAAVHAPHPAYTPGSPGGTGRPSPPQPVLGGRDLGIDFPLDGPRVLVAFLVSYANVELGQYWPIHQGRNVLGRQGAATGLDLEISHPTTSSLHAVLLAAARPGRVVVEDTSSTNGTFVNENMLAPGQRWELRDGDRVRFGLFDTVIKIVART